MMQLKLVKIVPRPYSRFHFGQMKMEHNLSLSDSDTFCHSDMLFAGLVNSHAKVYDSTNDFVKAFQEGRICISSLYYFIEKEGKPHVYLLPKPTFLTLQVKKQADGSHKRLGKIEFVSKAVWEEGLKINNWLDETKYRILQNKIILTEKEFSTYELNKTDKIFDLHSMPKSPQTDNKKESIFYQTDVVLHSIENATVGMYFLYVCDSSVLEIELKNAINILAFSGIGGEINLIGRTLGKAPEFDNTIFFEDANQFSNLSLYNPVDAEEFKKCKYYETSLRGGRRKMDKIHTKVVRMVDEGALFTSNEIKGRMVNLGSHEYNDNAILRNGMPLLIPVNYE